MARFAVLTLCAVVALLSGTEAESPIKYGMIMSTRAYDAVCWYENLVQFPKTNTDGFVKCVGKAQNVVSQIENDDDAKQYFGDWMIDLAMKKLPGDWKTICNDYLTDSAKSPPSDESQALNDPNSALNYPFIGFASCMMNNLRAKFGEGAIKTVENEMTHRTKDWRKTLLDRDNEFRARHGVPAFTMDSGLNSAAQTWAETMANACNLYHSENEDPGRQWNGAGTGESIAQGSATKGVAPPKAVSAYTASAMWYEEIKDYPFTNGHVKGDGLFEKIGHFTQTVWKSSKFVGYGYSYSSSCGQWFIAGRYSPAGNMQGDFQNNVLPPQGCNTNKCT